MTALSSRAPSRLLAVALAALALGVAAAPAGAAAPVPAPAGDDLGFVQFGAVGERVALACFDRALATPRIFDRGERRRLVLARRATIARAVRLNAVLGEDAVHADDFAIVFSKSAFTSRSAAARLGERIEGLLLGVYLNGAAYATDSATRLLLGRLATSATQVRASLRALRGAPQAHGLAGAIDLDTAGARLDAFLALPGETS